MVYEASKLKDRLLMIGDTPISFEYQYVQIGHKRYLISSGLLKLLFKQKLEEAYVNFNDLNN